MTDPKWSYNQDATITRVIDDRFYTIYKNTKDTWKYFVDGKASSREYRCVETVKRTIRKLVEKERKTPSVTNEPVRNTAQTVEWIKGVPRKMGNYLIYTTLGNKIHVHIHNDKFYRVWHSNNDYHLDNGLITHYIPLDNINPPKDK